MGASDYWYDKSMEPFEREKERQRNDAIARELASARELIAGIADGSIRRAKNGARGWLATHARNER